MAKNPSNPLLTRKSAALLTILILKASDIFDELFQRNAQRIVTILFSQIKIEMIQATIESIAEALMVCYQKYPQLTRFSRFFTLTLHIIYSLINTHHFFLLVF